MPAQYAVEEYPPSPTELENSRRDILTATVNQNQTYIGEWFPSRQLQVRAKYANGTSAVSQSVFVVIAQLRI